ncbi:MAG TPA: PHP-associated domain-containing protein [Candidatus Saccharimonadales bacterium]|nr:PHP-associated domain-containing protein [Candidatus Saccharimonadales bacterium]
MTDRLGRADLHVHTLASDGTAGVLEILAHVQRIGTLDVIAITDHERIDAALAARAVARDEGLPFDVIVGEEVTTRGGHLLALFVESPVRPLRSMRETIARIHDQGGLAIPAHPLFPFPMCAQGSTLRRLVADADPNVRPDALEAFNPTTFGRPHRRVVALAEELGLAVVGSSDAHAVGAVGQGYTTFPGRTAEDLRLAVVARQTHWHGSFHRMAPQLATFARQLRKYSRDASAIVRGGVLRNGTGRDLGYPGGHRRPAAFDAEAARPGLSASSGQGPGRGRDETLR